MTSTLDSLANSGLPPQYQPPISWFSSGHKPKVFVSFDYENDRRYKNLFEAWSTNTRFQFTFQDFTSREIMSNDVSRVKAALSAKISSSTYVVVVIGAYANQLHPDATKIGCRNWINFEIQQAILYKKRVVGVRLHPSYVLPEKILSSKGKHVEGFSQTGIMNALRSFNGNV